MDATELARIAAFEMRTHGFLPEFGAVVEAELRQPASEEPAASSAIRDLRDRLWFSIDNVDTLDLDQLSWAAALPDGGVRVAVAIADVDAKVRSGGAVDAHAAANTTLVYTAAAVFPMLPTVLSNDLTSLREGVDRLAVVVEMSIDGQGVVADTELYRARVRNHAKLDYDSVSAWLDRPGEIAAALAANEPLQAQLLLHDLAATSPARLAPSPRSTRRRCRHGRCSSTAS